MRKLLALLLLLATLLSLAGCQLPAETTASAIATTVTPTVTPSTTPPAVIAKDGVYNSKEDVALYIHTYGCLPKNYVTKSQANALGCRNLGRIQDYLENGAIGGDRFYNREGLLPTKDGRYYTECDIDTWNKTSRGAKRIVFSNDGLVYYTDDHYRSFTLLYGEP